MIVSMSKISITGLINERNAIIRRIMKLGVVELAEIPLADEERASIESSYADNATARINEIEEELRKIKSAISFLDFVQGKKKKSQKVSLTFDDFVNNETYSGCWASVFAANDLEKKLSQKNSDRNFLNNEILFLKLWDKLEVPLEQSKTKHTEVYIGTLPSTIDLDALNGELDGLLYAQLQLLESDKDQHYICLITHSNISEQVLGILKSNGFSAANFEKYKGTVSQNIALLEDRLKKTEDEIEDLQKSIEKSAENLPRIKMLYDYIFNMQERRRVRYNFLYTDKAFIVGGWVPKKLANEVKNKLEAEFNVFIEITEVEEGEETPVLLQNNAFAHPHEIITELYSLPISTGIDPTPIMSIFYCVFFGLMVSDAGYGVVISAICAIAIKMLKPKGMMEKLLKLMFFGGLSTIFWGALFGGWFGDFTLQAFGFEIKPLWFNPLTDPMRLLTWSFVFGGVHLFVGMAMKAYMLIKDGKLWDALMDVATWYMVLLGLTALFVGGTVGKIGSYFAIAGTVLLVLTQGRHEKNFFKKITSGILSLYDVTAYLSDILSYSRLLALGLATGVIASVVNTMGMLGGGFRSFGGAIVIIVAFIAGHVFNIAINAMGAYVHSSRLQYVEFFGKFYESGGKAFKPVRAITKYLNIN